jgi:rhodanese-related sulfurtransferase
MRAAEENRYCGVFAVQAAAQYFNKAFTVSDFLKPEYCNSPDGSSVRAVVKMAEQSGLHALAMERLSSADLSRLKCPAILLVKKTAGHPSPKHYIFFVNTGQGGYVIDGGFALRHLSYSDIAPRFYGDAVLVSDLPIRVSDALPPAIAIWLVTPVVISAIVLIAWSNYARIEARNNSAHSPRRFKSRITIPATAILIVSGLAATLYHSLSPVGLLTGGTGVAEVQRFNAIKFQPVVTAAELERLIASDSVLLIDARQSAEFEMGRIGNAINITSQIDRFSARKIVEKHKPGRRQIVIYCGGPLCSYAEQVGQLLLEEGYPNVRIYRSGWAEWSRRHSVKAAT